MWELLIKKYSPTVHYFDGSDDPDLPKLEVQLEEFYGKVAPEKRFVIPKLVAKYESSKRGYDEQLRQDGYLGTIAEGGIQDTSLQSLHKKLANKYLVDSLGMWLSGQLIKDSFEYSDDFADSVIAFLSKINPESKMNSRAAVEKFLMKRRGTQRSSESHTIKIYAKEWACLDSAGFVK